MKKLLVILAASGLVLSACGGGGDDKAKTVDNDSSKSESASSSSEGDLKAKLLAVADMPTGFTLGEDNSSDDENSDTTGDQFCKELDAIDKKYNTKDDVEVNFQKGEPGLQGAGFVYQSLGRFESVNVAKDAFSDFSGAMAKCKQFESTDADGTFKGSFTPLSFPKLGDGTYAAHLKGSGGDADFQIDLSGDFLVIRKSRIVMLLLSLGFGSTAVPTSELETIARAAVGKI